MVNWHVMERTYSESQRRGLQAIAEGACDAAGAQALIDKFGLRNMTMAMIYGIENGQIDLEKIKPFSVEKLLGGANVAAAIFRGKVDEEIRVSEKLSQKELDRIRDMLFRKSRARSQLEFVARMAKGLKEQGVLRYQLSTDYA